jgi:copper transporter 1
MDGMTMMNTSDGTMMMASDMAMVFFNSHTTPLYSMGWMPTGPAGYAGTCIFLIFLAISMRLLMVTKAMLEIRWHDQALQRRYITVEGQKPLSERIVSDPSSKGAVLSANGVEERVRIMINPGPSVSAWRFSTDLPRALLVTVMAGVGYLLMVAVMTLNIGYFMSILAGIFIGELALGRYLHVDDHGSH